METSSDDEALAEQVLPELLRSVPAHGHLGRHHPTASMEEPTPYRVTSTFTATEHIPPRPTPMASDKGVRYTSRRSILLRWRQPATGETRPLRLEFRIERELQAGNGWRAQVFHVSLCGESANGNLRILNVVPGSSLVAKVYDPMFFLNKGLDPFEAFDQFYTHEATAYARLEEGGVENIPRYHGSYSLSLPFTHPSFESREVRMILMEFINGQSMSNVDPREYSLEQRQHILQRIIELETSIYQMGITLPDLCPHNVLLEHANDFPSPVLMDFADAEFDSQANDGADTDSGSVKDDPMDVESDSLTDDASPYVRWVGESPQHFDEWVDWDWNEWLDVLEEDSQNSF